MCYESSTYKFDVWFNKICKIYLEHKNSLIVKRKKDKHFNHKDISLSFMMKVINMAIWKLICEKPLTTSWMVHV
jgi:hypothetical protein